MSDTTRWVHALNAHAFRYGQVFGWPSDEAETGLLSGIVIETDHIGLRVRVSDIRAGIINETTSNA